MWTTPEYISIITEFCEHHTLTDRREEEVKKLNMVTELSDNDDVAVCN